MVGALLSTATSVDWKHYSEYEEEQWRLRDGQPIRLIE
jgi:hypothetical protein